MQTFLASPSFAESAAVLDNKRLGKQRVENLQILKASLIPGYGWNNHPAVRMWREYLPAFLDYHLFICHEWVVNRGFKDTCKQKFIDVYEKYEAYKGKQDDPPWLRNAYFFVTHQSNLIRKDPFYYGPQFPNVPPDLDYWWPVL